MACLAPAKRLVVTALLFAAACAAEAQRTIILVRHAEKASDSNEPGVPLSEAGRRRAERLARMLSHAGVTAIYATDTDRARQTAEPLAKASKLEIRVYSARDAAGKVAPRILLDRLKKEAAAGVVLVVGHQNTVPDDIVGLGYRDKVEIGDRDFDDIFIVAPNSDGPPTVVRLKY